MKKHWITTLALALSFLVVLSACTLPALAAEDPSSLSGTLNVALAGDVAPEAIPAWIKMFKEDYPNVTVNVAVVDGGNVALTFDPLVAADTMPDVTYVDASPYFLTLAERGYFLDISDRKGWDKQYDVIKETYTTSDGLHFAVADGMCAMVLYYNEDHFKAAGISEPPTNWDEFVEACETLKAAGFVPYGVAGAGPNNMCHSLLGFGIAYEIFANGYDPDWSRKAAEGPYDFGTPEWQKVLERAAYMRDQGYFQPGYESTDLHGCLRLLASGEVSMSVHYSMQAGNIFINDDVHLNCTTVPWNPAGQPQVNIASASQGFALGRNNSGNLELAKIFFDYISYDHADVLQNMNHMIPPFKDKADMPNAIVDPPIQAFWDKATQLLTQPGVPELLMTTMMYDQAKVFMQEVILGMAEPNMIGEYLNPTQEEYVASIGR